MDAGIRSQAGGRTSLRRYGRPGKRFSLTCRVCSLSSSARSARTCLSGLPIFCSGSWAAGRSRGPASIPNGRSPLTRLIRLLILAVTLVVVFPYLPGSSSPAFRGISIFLGVLFSLGSTSAVANIIGGVILTYTRAFQIGDRVKIADTIGDVSKSRSSPRAFAPSRTNSSRCRTPWCSAAISSTTLRRKGALP